MKRRNVLLLAITVILTPAAWIAISDLYLGLIAAGSSPSKREEARSILASDVLGGRNRALQMRWLKPVAGQTASIVVSYRPLPTPLAKDPPTCPEYVIKAEKPKVEQFGIPGVVPVKAIPVQFPLRGRFEEVATLSTMTDDLSEVQLALLDSCFRASPFSGHCADWLEQRKPNRADLLKALENRGWLTMRSGSYCWATPEFRFSE